MIYQYTGQPGHGKTLQAINRALEFQKKGRIVYVCNVRDFDYEKTGMEKMTPEDFQNWMDFLPDGAVCLVDECYEKGMLPKRSAAQKLPAHVERLATHRHKGLDFIFVCQSPDKQMDTFVHDLIEEHVHVRRKFGTHFQSLRTFDKFERNPEKMPPLLNKRVRFPKHVFGLYKSTELDTTQKKVPWYIWGLAFGLPIGLGYVYWTFSSMDERLTARARAHDAEQAQTTTVPADGAVAKGAGTESPVITGIEFLERFTPRVATQPWSAPAYDDLSVPAKAPRVFCMSSGPSEEDQVSFEGNTCSCLTEQGTRYKMPADKCFAIARAGQYEPFYNEPDQVTDAQSWHDESIRELNQVHQATQIQKGTTHSEQFPRAEGYKASGTYLELPVSDPNG